jgi:hypothetical protein
MPRQRSRPTGRTRPRPRRCSVSPPPPADNGSGLFSSRSRNQAGAGCALPARAGPPSAGTARAAPRAVRDTRSLSPRCARLVDPGAGVHGADPPGEPVGVGKQRVGLVEPSRSSSASASTHRLSGHDSESPLRSQSARSNSGIQSGEPFRKIWKCVLRASPVEHHGRLRISVADARVRGSSRGA